jgi:hypothetical protein
MTIRWLRLRVTWAELLRACAALLTANTFQAGVVSKSGVFLTLVDGRANIDRRQRQRAIVSPHQVRHR